MNHKRTCPRRPTCGLVHLTSWVLAPAPAGRPNDQRGGISVREQRVLVNHIFFVPTDTYELRSS